jgi:uncharacterized protein (DUF2345 family)
MTNPVAQPTTEQIVAAFAQALLPLAGPAGIAVSALVPAVQQLLDNFTAHPAADVTVADLEAAVAQGNADLAKLQSDVAAT